MTNETLQRAAERTPTTIVASGDIAVDPERVLALAYAFSDRRGEIFPAVSSRHMTVHSSGPLTADVTEGTRVGPFVMWERCTYDWSEPGRVIATVIDSNVYAWPGSAWEITARPSAGGSHVTMTWTRIFRKRPRGRVMGFAYRHYGKRIFTKYAAEIMRNMETQAGT